MTLRICSIKGCGLTALSISVDCDSLALCHHHLYAVALMPDVRQRVSGGCAH